MHVHELNPWRTLIALSVFVILLVIGFITMKKPLISYELDMEESIAELTESDLYFYPWELDAVIHGEIDSIVLFDIRDNFLFGQGHIPTAENISANDLTNGDNIKRLEALKEMGTTVVLYGDDELQANGTMMLFRQVGFDNIKLLLGGYQYYFENQEDLYSTVEDDAYMKGYARYDYADMAAPKEGAVGIDLDKKPVQVQRRQKTNVAAGGC